MLAIEKCTGKKCASENETKYFFEQTRISLFISELRVALDVFDDDKNIKEYMVGDKYIPVTKLTK